MTDERFTIRFFEAWLLFDRFFLPLKGSIANIFVLESNQWCERSKGVNSLVIESEMSSAGKYFMKCNVASVV